MFVAAPGHDLVVGDFSNIEGRVLAWLADERWKCDAFCAFDAGHGPDIYALTYAKSFGITPEAVMENKKHGDGKMRQVGKVQELASGYGGGVGAYTNMCRSAGIDPIPDDATLDAWKTSWRDAHPATKQFWRDLENAAIYAVEHPGQVAGAGRYIKFRKAGSFLWCQLPNGRCLCYPYPRVAMREVPWTVREWRRCESREEAMFLYDEIHDFKDGLYLVDVPAEKPALIFKGVDAVSKKWCDQQTYGGSLAENVTQAVARDLLAEALLRLEAAGYPVVLHVHDEAVAEVPEGFGSVDEFESIMAAVPAWAAGCPIAVEGWRGKRYRKG